jgi:hypothetical protein
MATAPEDQITDRTASDELERAKRLINKLTVRTTDRGFTEDEAMDSAAKISQLLEAFDLRLDEVIIRQEKCVQRTVFAADDAMGTVITGIGQLCHLVVYHEEQRSGATTYVMFGMERDIELGVFLYEICHEAADEGWADHIGQGKGHTKKQRESYRMGFGSRLFNRFLELKGQRDRHREELRRKAESTGTDLVLVRDGIVDEEFAKTGVRLVSRRRNNTVHDRGAYNMGWDHADNVNLNSPIEGGHNPDLLR